MKLSQVYLLAYNVAQTLGWSYVGYKAVQVVPTKDLWSVIGNVLTIFQTAAFLEVVHSATGLVRSNPMLTAFQVSSRLIVVWLLYLVPESRSIYGLPALLAAWTVTEIIRYSYYAFCLVQLQPHFIQFLRYTLFVVLYPLGVSGELLCLYAALPYFKTRRPFSLDLPNSWNFSWDSHIVALIIMASYVPLFPQLYLHMFTLRKKVLGPSSKKAA